MPTPKDDEQAAKQGDATADAGGEESGSPAVDPTQSSLDASTDMDALEQLRARLKSKYH